MKTDFATGLLSENCDLYNKTEIKLTDIISLLCIFSVETKQYCIKCMHRVVTNLFRMIIVCSLIDFCLLQYICWGFLNV